MYLNMHAQDFLNAFEVLRESNEAFMDRQSGDPSSFSTERVFGTHPTMAVAVVCLAFSVELHLKDLHQTISGEVPQGHKILDLFTRLPDGAQEEIIRHPSIAQYGWDDSEFETELRKISEGFVKWRYAYESTTLRYNIYFAKVLIEATSFVASSKRGL